MFYWLINLVIGVGLSKNQVFSSIWNTLRRKCKQGSGTRLKSICLGLLKWMTTDTLWRYSLRLGNRSISKLLTGMHCFIFAGFDWLNVLCCCLGSEISVNIGVCLILLGKTSLRLLRYLLVIWKFLQHSMKSSTRKLRSF